ncbi:MAG: hypothetical protein AAGF24_13275 [Cyanobacteria bacterium P01_H01_bin.121]
MSSSQILPVRQPSHQFDARDTDDSHQFQTSCILSTTSPNVLGAIAILQLKSQGKPLIFDDFLVGIGLDSLAIIFLTINTTAFLWLGSHFGELLLASTTL